MITEFEFDMIDDIADEFGIGLCELDDDTVALTVQLFDEVFSFDVSDNRNLMGRLDNARDKCLETVSGLTEINDVKLVRLVVGKLGDDHEFVILRK